MKHFIAATATLTVLAAGFGVITAHADGWPSTEATCLVSPNLTICGPTNCPSVDVHDLPPVPNTTATVCVPTVVGLPSPLPIVSTK
jgi:hypothetical protein